MWSFDLLFSSLLQLWYFEVRIFRSVSESPSEFEITRVDCIAGRYFGRKTVYQYCSQPFANNWQLLFLNQRKWENDRRKYFMTKSPWKNVADPAGVEPAISWLVIGRLQVHDLIMKYFLRSFSSADLRRAVISFWRKNVNNTGNRIATNLTSWIIHLQSNFNDTG